MRIASLVFSFVVTVSLATVAYAFVAHRVGQNRIAVQDGWISSDEPRAYQAYGQPARSERDSVVKPVAHRDSF